MPSRSEQAGSVDEAKPAANPVEGLYAFVRGHLTPINQVVAGSATLVALLDFMSPRLSVAPMVVYSITAAIAGLMLLAAIAPGLADRLISVMGGVVGTRGSVPLWRRPAWQVGFAVALGVSILGWASVARAAQGGLIASQFPAARSIQEQLLGLRRDTADIKRGIDAANGKLDILVGDSKDPRKDLVASGYQVNDSGLMRAIKQGDARAVGLFARIGYPVASQGPMAVVLNGDQPWDGGLAASLPASMFSDPAACAEPASLLNYPLRPPAAERVATFKRLCGSDHAIAMLRQNIADDARSPAVNDQQARMQAARKTNLALLAN